MFHLYSEHALFMRQEGRVREKSERVSELREGRSVGGREGIREVKGESLREGWDL